MTRAIPSELHRFDLSLVGSEDVTITTNQRWETMTMTVAELPEWFWFHMAPPDGTGDYVLLRMSDIAALTVSAAGEVPTTSTGLRIPDTVGGGSDVFVGRTTDGELQVALTASSFSGRTETFEFWRR